MALRSLVVMLKGLSRRMPGSSAFAPKGNQWSKLTDPTKYAYVEEIMSKRCPHLLEKIKLDQEESLRQMRIHHWKMVLAGFVSFGSVGYVSSHV